LAQQITQYYLFVTIILQILKTFIFQHGDEQCE